MAVERTFSIIKPDATGRNLTGAVNAVIEQAGLRIVAQKRVRMRRAEAETFYGVHRERPFFGELVEFMTSGPDLGARRRGRRGDRDAAGDDRRHGSRERRAGHDSRRSRLLDARQPRARLRLPRVGGA